MRIIDADSHFQEPADWFEKANPKLAAELPQMSAAEKLVDVVVGDLFASVPPAIRPDPMKLVPPKVRDAYEDFIKGGEPPRQVVEAGAYLPAASEPEPRLAWMDERGIDMQIVLPTLGYHPYRNAVRAGRADLALQTLDTYNRWAAERLHGYTDRLIPTVVVDLVDVDWSRAQMRMMRAQGATVVFVKADPQDNKALNHPDFEPFWAEAQDLGMTIMFHVGGGRAPMHPGWGNMGDDIVTFYRLASIARELVPQMAIASMIFGGVMERYPRLGFIVSELGIDWLPHFIETIDAQADMSRPKMLSFGRYELPMKPSDYMQRQVRVSVVHQQDALRPTIDRIPEGIVVFSSDFPHVEGHQDAVRIYDEQLGDVSQSAREAFFGKAVAEIMHV